MNSPARIFPPSRPPLCLCLCARSRRAYHKFGIESSRGQASVSDSRSSSLRSSATTSFAGTLCCCASSARNWCVLCTRARVCECLWVRGCSRCVSCTTHTGSDAHMQCKALPRLPTRTHACSRGAHPLCDELRNIHQADLYKIFGTNVHLQVSFWRWCSPGIK